MKDEAFKQLEIAKERVTAYNQFSTEAKEQQAKDIQAVIDGTKKLSDDEIENTRIRMLAESGLRPEDLFT